MTQAEQHDETMKDIRKLAYADRHENEARRICKPWMFASTFARDMAIIDVAHALRMKS
jgi:hypothetical protein